MKTKASPIVAPCIESTRCLLTCPSRDVRLTSCCASAKKGKSDGGGVVVSTTSTAKRQSCNDEWSIVPADGGLVVLHSLKCNKYLSCGDADDDGSTTITLSDDANSDFAKWRVEASTENGGGGIHLLSAAREQSKLACNEDGDLYLSQSIYECMGETWKIEFLSGELLYVSSVQHDVRLRCDPTGILDPSQNWKGWEVFRFIEAGDGSVYISSWTHYNHYLSSSADGRVFATKKRGVDTKWTVTKAENGKGVVIVSQAHGRALATNGNRLLTADPVTLVDNNEDSEEPSGIWDLVPANRNIFYISSASSNKYIGSIPCKRSGPSDAVTTNKRRAWEQWAFQEADDGAMTLCSTAHQLYFGVDKLGKITLSEAPGLNELWTIEESPHGGVFIVSDEHRSVLSCDTGGKLMAVTDKSDLEETFRLEPCMPPSRSGPMIAGIVGGGLATAAFACAAPFMVTGVVAAMGFGEAGIAAGSVAAGMMSAEAAAAGGGVAAGGLVASLQAIGAAGLGFVGTSTAIAGGAIVGSGVSAATVAGISNISKQKDKGDGSSKGVDSITPTTNRPFSAWKTWSSH